MRRGLAYILIVVFMIFPVYAQANHRAGATGTQNTVTCADGTATTIVGTNQFRISITVKNISAGTIYIGLTSAVTATTGLEVTAAAVFTADHYIGSLFCFSSGAAREVRYAEELAQ